MSRLLDGIDRAVEWLVFLIFLAIVLVGAAQVINRFFLNYSLSWSEEFQRYGQIWIVFLGIPVAYRRGAHIGLDLVPARLGRGGRLVFSMLVELLWAGLALAILVGTVQLMHFLRLQHSPGLGLRMDWVYGGILGGAVYTILVAARRMIAHARAGLPG
jgi:TRAP-type C4-dicarboxylate transport system permease small subunit